MNTIILNSTNVVLGTNNSTLTYNFPNSITFDNHEIAVHSINMYYSWCNISSALGNNTFTYAWVNGITQTTLTVLIPDGLWEISDINNYLQFQFIQNGHYLINSSGQNVYYAEFLVNPNRYSINIITYSVPTTLPSGWTTPIANPATGAIVWGGFPTQTFNPIITLPSSFNIVLGYSSGFATAINTGNLTTLTYNSSVSPQVSTIPSLLLTMTNVSNIYSSPSNIVYSVVPDVGFGELIQSRANQYVWSSLLKGTQNSLTLRFVSNTLSNVNILDPNMTIMLLVRKAKNQI